MMEECRLHVPEATTAAYAAAEQRLRREGIRIVALAELGPDDEAFLRALRRLWGHWAGEEVAGGSLAESRRDMWRVPASRPRCTGSRYDRERPVGTMLLTRLNEDAAENAAAAAENLFAHNGVTENEASRHTGRLKRQTTAPQEMPRVPVYRLPPGHQPPGEPPWQLLATRPDRFMNLVAPVGGQGDDQHDEAGQQRWRG